MTNPPDTSVTERVARALADSECSELRRMGIQSELKHWKLFEAAARAAISSMPASLTRKDGSEGVEKLAEALVAHNDALRSCCAVADRDGKDTNWTGLRGTIRMTLLPYHETVNEARALKEGASREG